MGIIVPLNLTLPVPSFLDFLRITLLNKICYSRRFLHHVKLLFYSSGGQVPYLMNRKLNPIFLHAKKVPSYLLTINPLSRTKWIVKRICMHFLSESQECHVPCDRNLTDHAHFGLRGCPYALESTL